MLVTKRIDRERDVPGMTGPARAAANDLALLNRPASQPGADDDHEQRRQRFVRQVGRRVLPLHRSAADGELAQRGGLSVAQITYAQPGAAPLEGAFQLRPDGKFVPLGRVQVGRFEQHAVHGGGPRRRQPDGRHLVDRSARRLDGRTPRARR